MGRDAQEEFYAQLEVLLPLGFHLSARRRKAVSKAEMTWRR